MGIFRGTHFIHLNGNDEFILNDIYSKNTSREENVSPFKLGKASCG